jgi:outer membrane protein
LEALVLFKFSVEKDTMLRITLETKHGKTLLNVEGRLTGSTSETLEQCWRELRASKPEEKFAVNLCGVSFIDEAGKILLAEIHRQGARLSAEGCLNQAIVREIVATEKSENKRTSCKRSKTAKGSHIIFYVAMFGLLGGAQAAHAQSSMPQGTAKTSVPADQQLKLTLEQAVKLALRQNPTAQIAVLQAAESQEDKNIARADLLPQANFNLQQEWTRENLKAQFGGNLPFPGIPSALGPFGIFSTGVGFSGPLFDLTLFRRFQASRMTENASKANSLSTREQVILLVVSQYIGSLRAEANVEASRSRVDLAQALFQQAEDLQTQGVGTGIDTLRANVELQNEKQRLIEAVNDRESSLYALSRLLNLDPRTTIVLADRLSFYQTPQPEVQASIDEALQDRQEWKSLEDQIKAQEYSKKAASEQRLPSVHYSGDWTQLGTSPGTVIPTYTYAGSIDVPLFTGGKIHAEMVKADLVIKQLEEQQSDLRNQIALDVKTALLNLDSARSEVQVADLGVQLAKQEVDQARDRFKAGVANNIEVIQAQDSLARANDNQIAALYRFNEARADYARSIGQMETLYAK